MDMRSQIMDASRRLFLERGYRGTSMREIAAACGIKVGNLNYYFRKKEDLLMLHHNNLMDSYCGSLPAEFFSEPWSGYIAVEYCFLRAIAESEAALRLYNEVVNVPSLREVYCAKHHELFLRFFPEDGFELDSREVYFSTVSMCAVEFRMMEQYARYKGVVAFDSLTRYFFLTRLTTLHLDDGGRIDAGISLGNEYYANVLRDLRLE